MPSQVDAQTTYNNSYIQNIDTNPYAQVLKSGKDARGQAVIPEEEVKTHVGKGIGFSTLAVRHRLAVYRDGVEWMKNG